MLPQAYLTNRQLEILQFRYKGVSKAQVGRYLGITRQAVYDAEKIMLKKIKSALLHLADASKIEVKYIDPSKGILYGYDHTHENQIVITFSARNGIQTWHYKQSNCEICREEQKCKERLLIEAKERNIILSEEQTRLKASELAHVIFTQIIPGINIGN